MTRRLWKGLQRHRKHLPEHLKTVGFKSNTKFSVFAEAVWVHYLATNTCALWISVWRTCRRLHSIENIDKTSTETWMLTLVLLGRWPLRCCHTEERCSFDWFPVNPSICECLFGLARLHWVHWAWHDWAHLRKDTAVLRDQLPGSQAAQG